MFYIIRFFAKCLARQLVNKRLRVECSYFNLEDEGTIFRNLSCYLQHYKVPSQNITICITIECSVTFNCSLLEPSVKYRVLNLPKIMSRSREVCLILSDVDSPHTNWTNGSVEHGGYGNYCLTRTELMLINIGLLKSLCVKCSII